MIRPTRPALAGAVALSLTLAIPADAATTPMFEATTLFESMYRVPGSTAVNTAGRSFVLTDPIVLTSRGTLTAQVLPATFGAAIQNLSFNLALSTQAKVLSWSGPAGAGGWTGSVELDPGTYFAIVSARTAPRLAATTPAGFFGVRLSFVGADAAVIPLPAAGVLLAGALGFGVLFARRRRRADEAAGGSQGEDGTDATPTGAAAVAIRM